MLERLSSLSAYNYLYAALLAFCITYFIMKLRKLKGMMKNDELTMNITEIDKNMVMERCTKMFPIESVSFNGTVFRKGMNVRITPMQKKVFQGEFIGKNDIDVICIVTKEHIIAHEIRKIVEMVSLDETK